MELKTKKIIAREALLIIGAAFLSAIIVALTIPYNSIYNSQATNFSIQSSKKKIVSDSLGAPLINKLLQQQHFINTYKSTFPLDTVEMSGTEVWSRLEEDSKNKLIKNLYDSKWSKSPEQKKFFDDLFLPSRESIAIFVTNNIITKTDRHNHEVALKIREEAESLENRAHEAKLKIINWEEQLSLEKTLAVIFLIALYPARALWILITWSIRVLRQNP